MPRPNAAQASLFDAGMLPTEAANDDGSVEIYIDNPLARQGRPEIDPTTGSMVIPLPDGSVIIDMNPAPDWGSDEDSNFDENLADKLDAMQLSRIASELLEGIEDDENSRSQWLADRDNGLSLLGLKLEQTKGDVGATTAPLEGMATVRHPMLLEAVLRAQANAYGELCPASGPVKVVNYGQETTEEDGLAQALERDINFYLTTTATEYYRSYKSMLFNVMFSGTSFRKIYRCPLRRRPVSETVDADDLIVNNTASDLHNAARVTHKVTMRRSVMKRMQLLGVYRRVELSQPNPEPNEVELKIANIQGIDITSNRPEDQDFELYECYCELNIPGYEHTDDDGEASGLPLPYRVTIDKTSRQVLEIRRNWEEDQEYEDYLAKIPFVPFNYVTGLGFYGIGLLHILGNTTNAVTAAWREMLDAGMFANFPGFLYLQGGGRQQTNEFRVPPGGGLPIKSDAASIRDAVMPLPYKSADSGFMAFIDNVTETGQRVGGTADMPVGEGKQDAPVGTTLALIEQSTKIESTVHKGLHSSQDEEFRLLKELFRQDPESIWRSNRRCALRRDRDKTLTALEDCDLVPRADPNVPSRMHRLAKIAAVKQLQAQNPMLYDGRAVDMWALPQLGVDDPESLFAPPQEAQPDPIKMQELMIKAKQAATAEFKAVTDAQNKAADRRSKEQIAILDLGERIASNPGALPEVSTFLANP